MSLKQKTIHGLTWSFIDSFTSSGFSFIVGIILARILSPREFGLIGMITIFIAVSQSFIDSGFSNALIRKKDCKQEDFSTVFYFNIFISLIFTGILIIAAPKISDFFKEPELNLLVQVLSIGLIINAFGIIQRTIFIKNIDFKKQTKISIIASLGSGIIALTMAYSGFGVWSLVALTLSKYFLNSLFFWIWSSWKPEFVFSKKSFRELFCFGSKILVSGLIDTIYRNVYYLVIGKFFNAQELGYYTRADQFQTLPSSNLNDVITRVSFPVLSSIQDEPERLMNNYKKLIRSTMFITFVLMLGMAAVAKSMILVLIGEKWLPSVIYLQLLCLVGMFYPLHALNLNMLQIKGRSDLFLRLEIIKKILAIPIIAIGIFCGIIPMIVGMIINTIIAYYLNSYWSGKLIGYSFLEQIKDILPGFFIASIMAFIIFIISLFITTRPLILLLIQIGIGVTSLIILCELIKFKDYIYIKQLIIDKLTSLKTKKDGK